MVTGIWLIISLCSALHYSYFWYILFGFFRYMPIKSTLFRKIIFPKSYKFAHLPANEVCLENTRRNIYTEIWSELSELYLFFSLFSGVFGSKQIVPLWIKDGNNWEEAMMIFAQKVLWLSDYDEHGEASLDGVRVSTQPVCCHFLLCTWGLFGFKEVGGSEEVGSVISYFPC